MAAEQRDIAAMLDAWRARGADRRRPVAFHRIEALHRRASLLEGEARCLADARLAALVEAHAADLDGSDARPAQNDASPDAAPGAPTLGALVEYLAQRARAADRTSTVSSSVMSSDSLPQIDALSEARRAWSGVRSRSQVRQSLEQTAEGAGPLNSGRLVHRALQVMGDCSPAYLEHFLAYVDVLAWLEPLSQPQGEAAAAAQHRRKPARKPRAPRAKRRPQGSPGTSTDQPSR